MKIGAQLRVNEAMDSDTTEVASGWVEIEECIKFPVKVRKYVNEEGKEKMFVSYPQRKTEQGYSNLVYPDKEIKAELENYILTEVGHAAVRGYDAPPVRDVRVNIIDIANNRSPVQLKGYATIKIAGFTINGIMIKEGKNGLFVQMPQHKSGGEYKDTVYGTNRLIQMNIKEEVLAAYKNELEKRQEPEYDLQEEKEQEEAYFKLQNAGQGEQKRQQKHVEASQQAPRL